MSNKIEGVPEGWKIKRIGSARDDDYIPWFDYEKDKIVAKKYSDVFDLVNRPACCIIERDIKIIDMSKCKVDIEFQCSSENNWSIAKFDDFDDIEIVEDDKIRVRKNHYFGWQGGECPLPEGLLIRATFAESRQDVLHIYSMDAISHDLEFDNPCLIGFEIKRPCKGHAYKHEIEGVSDGNGSNTHYLR